MLRDVGTVQLWYGDETGVIWEAFYATGVREKPEHERLLHQLWEACERLLNKNGARFAYTQLKRAELRKRVVRRFPARQRLQPRPGSSPLTWRTSDRGQELGTVSQDSGAPMSADAKLTVTISIDLLLPVPEESLESYLAYCEQTVVDVLKPRLRETLISFIESRRKDDP